MSASPSNESGLGRSPVSPLSRRPIHRIQVGSRATDFSSPDFKPTVRIEHERVFGGPLGAVALMLLLPVAVFVLNVCVRKLKGERSVWDLLSLAQLVTPDAGRLGVCALVVCGWIAIHALFYRFFGLLGSIQAGRCEPYMRRVYLYRCNGFVALVLCLGAECAAHAIWGVKFDWLLSNWIGLCLASIALSYVISILLYIKGARCAADQKSDLGNTGNLVYDLFMGREANPRWQGVDFKFVLEMRVALISWAVYLCALLLRHAALKHYNWTEMSAGLLFICFTQLIYIADALWNEASMLSTLDLIHEGLGFMLVFGNVVWVPFVFTLHASYTYRHPATLPHPLCLVPPVLLFVIGFYIMRGANSQKDTFRRSTEGQRKDLGWTSIWTGVRDRDLLCDGWWGWARHANYTGDLLIAAAWSAAAGVSSLLPHVYLVYLSWLLLARLRRDEELCARKYGRAWLEYCERVPYRLVKRVW